MQYEIHFKATYTMEVEASNKELAEKIAYIRLNDIASDLNAGDFIIEETAEIN